MSAYAYSNPQAIFYQQYEATRRDEVVGVLLALFLGSFGVHHFYLRRTGLGILYACFFWSGIPGFIGFIECFFMPGRVREFNAMQAAAIAGSLGIQVPGWGVPPVNVNVNMPPGPMPGSGFGTGLGFGAGPVVTPPPPPVMGIAPPSALVACGNCQRVNAPGARFCSGCGTAIA